MKITVLAAPKKFIGHTKLIQDNAINSWIKIFGKENICLFGDEETRENSTKKGVFYEKPETNEKNLPLINSIFEIARDKFTSDYFLYINSDIIILSNFIKTFNQCNNKFDNGFFLIGRRTDLNIENLIDFSEDKIEESLILESSKSGKLSEVTSIDYFLFPHNNFKTIPPLRIGRAGYDNLLIYWAKKYEKIPIIDGTENILAIHQKHDYKHVSGGKNEVYEGKEAMENIKMSGGADKLFFITESDYKVKDQKIIKNNGWRYYLSKRYLFNVLPALHPFFYPLVLFKNSIKYIKK